MPGTNYTRPTRKFCVPSTVFSATKFPTESLALHKTEKLVPTYSHNIISQSIHALISNIQCKIDFSQFACGRIISISYMYHYIKTLLAVRTTSAVHTSYWYHIDK